jgi:hypothetical protein
LSVCHVDSSTAPRRAAPRCRYRKISQDTPAIESLFAGWSTGRAPASPFSLETHTEACERLLARLLPALENVNEALDEVNVFRDTLIGTLRLNVPRSAKLVVGQLLGPLQET